MHINMRIILAENYKYARTNKANVLEKNSIHNKKNNTHTHHIS